MMARCSILLGAILAGIVAGKTCLVTDYGAKGDNSTDDTAGLQSAIDDCRNDGTVVVPKGIFITSPLIILNASGLTLQLSSTSVIRACSLKEWPVETGRDRYVDFLQVIGGSGVTIHGGLLDGGGTPWYAAFDKGQLPYERPKMLVTRSTSNFRLLHITILNSPFWNVNLQSTDTAEVGWVNITSQWYMDEGVEKEPHNTDGINPDLGSRKISIHDCHIYNGDDSIAVKPGDVNTGCTRDVYIHNCHFFRGHGASIGSVGKGCVRDVVFRNITMDGQQAGCRVKTYSDGPGFVTNITWRDITITGTSKCITVDANYKPPPPKPVAWIEVSQLNFINVNGTGCKTTAEFNCPETSPCTHLQMQHVNLQPATKQMQCQFAHGRASDVTPAACLLPDLS